MILFVQLIVCLLANLTLRVLNYCDLIFARQCLLAKFAKINTHFLVTWYIHTPQIESSVILGKIFRGQTNVSRNRGGHRLELKDINCENWLKLRGGKTIFRVGGKLPPSNPLKTWKEIKEVSSPSLPTIYNP